jgi:two-component sensor histidine kinase
MTPEQLQAILPEQFTKLTLTDLVALKPLQIQAITPQQISQISPDVIAQLGRNQWRELLPSQIEQLQAPQLKRLSTEQISNLSLSQLNALSKEQIAALQLTQIASLNPKQQQALRPEQLSLLNPEQLQAFTNGFKGRPQQFELPLKNTEGDTIWWQCFLNPVHVNGKFQELSCLVYDNTDRKEIDRKIRDSLKEKEVLLKEVHHRVKNNLQVISSILNLQSSYVDDPKTLEILRESQQRIKSMSFIHETIYRTSDFSRLEFMDYLKTIISNLIQSYRSAKTRVDFVAEMHSVGLNLDQAIPCGLIVNELVSNSLKYAFKGREHGKLTIKLNEEDGVVMLAVMDDGIGLPADFAFEKNNSLGIQLVYALLDQIDATVKVDQTEGTQFFISFKRK